MGVSLLSLAPPCLRGMLRAVEDYDSKLENHPSCEMVLPDALSRLSQCHREEVAGTNARIHELVDVTQSRLGRPWSETEYDEVLQTIKTFVWSGWPSSVK